MRPVVRWPIPILVLLLAVLAGLGARLVVFPTARVGKPPGAPGRVQLVLGARPIGWGRVDVRGVVWAPADLVREHFDPALRLLTPHKAQTSTSPWRLDMASPEVARFLRAEPVLVEFYAWEGRVPLDALQEMYGVSVRQVGPRVLIDRAGREIPVVSTRSSVRLRARPWPLWPGPRVPAGAPLLVYDRVGKWLLVRADDGTTGFVPASQVQPAGVHLVPVPRRVPPLSVRPPVCLVWEHFLQPAGPDLDRIGPLPGVTVVCPTWLHLQGGDGSLSSGCHASYVRWAHDRGYAVWVLVGNNFDPDLTRQVLRDGEARRRLIRQLLVYCRLFSLDGINVDFENVYPSEKEAFVQFVRELGQLARLEGLPVSVDVTVKSPSPTWSAFLDRRSLARVADYLVLMAYDEHYAGSPRPGPVASLPWVEKGIRGLLEEVPPERLLLGMPFYTRLWRQEGTSGSGSRPTSRALGMDEAEALLAQKGVSARPDPGSGQDYARWEEGGAVYQVWLENERSVAARLDLARKYGLAGVAAWRRGFEKPTVWEVILSRLRHPR